MKGEAEVDPRLQTLGTRAEDWPQLPTETEIYILPDGTVVVADMPMELAELVSELGEVLPCEIAATEGLSGNG